MADALLASLVLLHTLGAAVWFGGTVAIALVNRALRTRLADVERRETIRHLGRASAPILVVAFVVAAASGLALWAYRGWVAGPLGLSKSALALAAAGLMLAHVRLGRGESATPHRAAALGMLTLVVGLGLFVLGAAFRQT